MSKYFVHNNSKDSLYKFDPRNDKGIFFGISNNSRSFRIYNKCTLFLEESIHVMFDDTNPMDEKGTITCDEDIN